MDLALSWEPSGGVCDGNFFAAAGLPTIDTLGVIGGDIHTFNEYVELDSIPQRVELVHRLLTRIVEDGKNW
jgi:glutamate carboxypeptidase